MDIQILPVPVEQAGVLENLMHLYLYDFSELTGDDVDDIGLYTDEHLHLYWIEPERYPFLIQVDGKHAGFVLVRRMPAESVGDSNAPTHSIAEFFILRKFRRQKVGQQAAWSIFDRFPGRWLVAEIPENLPAQAFWRKIIGEYTGGNYQEVTLPGWDGPTQEFYSPAETQPGS